MPRLAVVPDLDTELDDLYGAPLGEFTRRRNDLERRLQAAGQADAAASVAALKKPSVPAWVVNQVARRDTKAMEKLLAAAREVADAQSADDPGPAVAQAAAAHRDALQRIAAELDRVAGRALSEDVRQRALATLRNASLDPAAHADLARGRLEVEHSAAGFDLVAGLDLATAKKAGGRRSGDERRRELAQLREQREQLRGELTSLRRELRARAKDATRARAEADRAQALVDELAAELQAREASLSDLDARLRA